MKVFFADPHSPWQRGVNENTNGLLRQHFPKGIDLSRWGAKEIEAVAHILTTRARKTLSKLDHYTSTTLNRLILQFDPLAKNVAASGKKSRSFFTKTSSRLRLTSTSSLSLPEPPKAYCPVRLLRDANAPRCWSRCQAPGPLACNSHPAGEPAQQHLV